MLNFYYSGRKITIQPDSYEELNEVKKVVNQMEVEGDVKVYDKDDFVVVFVTNKKLQVLEVLIDIKMIVEKAI